MGIESDVEAACADVEQQVIAWRHHLHRHPELSNREVNTAKYVGDHLRSLKLDEVRTGIAGHGVVGVLRGPGERVIALRADMDALPVRTIGHAQDTGRFNIIGGSLTLLGTIRCSIESDMDEVRRRLTRLATGIAEAFGCSAEVTFDQEVPAVHNTPAWVDAALPTLRRAVGEDRVVESPPTLGYDDVSVFVNEYGGLYIALGVQDAEVADGGIRPTPGGRGLVMNHHPGFYADDSALVTGVRLHCAVAVDHLAGRLQPG